MPVQFNGTNQYLVIPPGLATLQNIGSFTYCAWLNITVNPSTFYTMTAIGINNGGNASENSRFIVYLNTTGQIVAGSRAPDTAGLPIVTTTVSVPLSVWNHVAVVANIGSDSILVYLNGAQVATTGAISFTPTATDNSTSTSNTMASSNLGASEFLNGLLADIRLYNFPLTPSAIETIHSGYGHDSVHSGMINRWIFDDNAEGVIATGSSVVKDSGNQNHANALNSPVFREGVFSFRRRF